MCFSVNQIDDLQSSNKKYLPSSVTRPNIIHPSVCNSTTTTSTNHQQKVQYT